MSRQHLGPILAMFLLPGLFSLPAVAAKTDVVILINGNAVTGEVKSLEFGLLRYSTDSMGTVDIDWEDIVSVTSKQHLQIELADGTRYFGELMPTGDSRVVRIVTLSDEIVMEANRIVRITPIETNKKFWKRLDGSFSLGLQTQKASGISTGNLAADVSYRTRAYLLGLRLSGSVTDQPTEPYTTARQSINLGYQRFRKNRWFNEWFTGWEMADEQGIEGRSSVGGGIGRYFLQTNKNQLSLSAGLQGSHTTFTGDDAATKTAEGKIEIRYQRRNLLPKSSFKFMYTFYPLLEHPSEFRAESDMSFRREVFKDLFLDLTFSYSYISYPPEGSSTTDYTATTSIGYSF